MVMLKFSDRLKFIRDRFPNLEEIRLPKTQCSEKDVCFILMEWKNLNSLCLYKNMRVRAIQIKNKKKFTLDIRDTKFIQLDLINVGKFALLCSEVNKKNYIKYLKQIYSKMKINGRFLVFS